MVRPPHFTHLFVVTRNLPYERRSAHWNGASMTGGVLGKGTSIWAEGSYATHPSSRPAWIEEVGEIYVDGRCLTAFNVEPPQRMTQLPQKQEPQSSDTTLIQFP